MTLREAGKNGVPTEIFGARVRAEVIELISQGEMWNLDDLMAQDAEMLEDDIDKYYFYDDEGGKIR